VRIGLNIVLGLGLVASPVISAELPVTETIVLVRHGEKPAEGLGQLNCQGLNRAVALPVVIGKLFGRPDAIFAPDPAQPKEDYGRLYNYVRPLATIEPTAIAFGLPVDASIGVSDLDAAPAKTRIPGSPQRPRRCGVGARRYCKAGAPSCCRPRWRPHHRARLE